MRRLREDREKMDIYEPTRETFKETNPAYILVSIFRTAAFRTVRKQISIV